jgi:N-acetylmuramoyl-L-alanine amidase
LFFLVLSSSAASGVSFARLIEEDSFAKDKLLGGLEINLKLSQGVPYKMRFLEDPLSLIIDFNVLSFTGTELQNLNRSKNVKLIEFEKLSANWSRLSIQFRNYWTIENTEMRIDPNDSSAIISILLNSVTKDDFKSKNINASSLLHSGDLEKKENSSATNNSDFVVVLDPGHGGKDPGAEAGGYRESNLMLELAAAVEESLVRNTEFKVILTRKDDTFLSLEDRITVATQSGADLFISLHADAVIEGEATGTTVYLLSENATDKMSAQLASRHDRSEILKGVDLSGLDSQVTSVLIDMARQETKPRNEAVASFILEVFREKITELSSQPLRYAAFSVLKSPGIPSILIEAGFMSTSSNLKNLTTPSWRAGFAEALAEAILRWQIKDKQTKFLMRE